MEQNARLFLLQQSYFIGFIESIKDKLKVVSETHESVGPICSVLSVLISVENYFSQVFNRAIEHSPTLIIAKPCHEDIKLLRIMSMFLFPDRLKVLKSVAEQIEVCEYYQKTEEEFSDFLLDFPLQRLHEYFDLFQSLSVICPEDHPDYYYRSKVLQELKNIINITTLQLNDAKQYKTLKSFLLSFHGMPEWFIDPNRKILFETEIFLPKEELPMHAIAILTSHEIIITTKEREFQTIIPIDEVEYSSECEKRLIVVYNGQQEIEIECGSIEEFDYFLLILKENIAIRSRVPIVKIRTNKESSEDEELGESIVNTFYREGMMPNYLRIAASLLQKNSGVRTQLSPGKSKKHEYYFTGSDAVEWISTHLNVEQTIATSITNKLFALGFFRAVDGIRFENDPNAKFYCHSNRILNQTIIWDRAAPDPVNLSCQLLQILLDLFHYYAPLYKRFDLPILESYRLDPNYKKFQFLVCQLQQANLGGLNNTERIVFYINTYNMLALHSYIEFPKATKKKKMITRLSFFRKASYHIGADCCFNLWDIDHGCLRAFSSGPAGLFSGTLLPKFKSGDPRFPYRVTTPTPFINFALNPGTQASPPIQVYICENLQEQLIQNFQQFAANNIHLEDHSHRHLTVRLPKILQWFYRDFGATEKIMVESISAYLAPEYQERILEALSADKLSLKYDEYRWSFTYPL